MNLKLIALSTSIFVASIGHGQDAYSNLVVAKPNHKFSITKSEAEWKKLLPKESFLVLRKEGTERSFTGKYWNNHQAGIYRCMGCQLDLFSSKTKFESGTGWPSFYQEIAKGRTLIREDRSLGEVRNEVICSRCGGHLGHVFDDGPAPTHLRYCMNSVSLAFVKTK